MWSDLHDREDGAALVFVLFVAIVIGGLATLMLTAATFETRTTGAARDEEAAIHAADAGADLVFGRVLADPAYATPHAWSGGATPTAAEERAWLLAQPLGTAASVATGDGGGYGIGPVDVGDKTYVYGVGITGDPGAPRARRTVRTEIVRSGGGLGDAAMLVGGDLEFVGGIAWLDGGVHTNSDFLYSNGYGITVTGTMTASGSLPLGASGTPTVQGSATGKPLGAMPTQAVPDYTAAAIHQQYAATLGPAGKWYDLCRYVANGQDRGQVRRGAATPCTGTVLQSLPGENDSWRGWRYQPKAEVTNKGVVVRLPRTWTKTWPTSTAEDSGVFYAHHSNMETRSLNGNSGVRSSYFASADPGDTALQAGERGGNVDFHGYSPVRHATEITPWAVFADRDIHTSDEAGSRTVDGVLYAREQIEIHGTLGESTSSPMTGSIIAGDFTDSPGSPVSTSQFGNSIYIRSVPAYDVGSSSGVQVYSWTEL